MKHRAGLYYVKATYFFAYLLLKPYLEKCLPIHVSSEISRKLEFFLDALSLHDFAMK